LIAAASFILVDRSNDRGSALRDHRTSRNERLDDTLFADAKVAAKFLGMRYASSPKEQLDRMREHATPQPIDSKALSPPRAVGSKAHSAMRTSRSCARCCRWSTRCPSLARWSPDLILDALAYVISAAVLLQNERFATAFRERHAYAETFGRRRSSRVPCAELIDVR
jgi:hypothetical protein